jgi:hypothetical protein
MTLISKFATAFALVAMLGLTAPAHAQGKSNSKTKAKVSKKAKNAKKGKTTKNAPKTATKLPKAKDYDFLADEIDGDRPLPNHDRILGLSPSNHGSLIRLRQHFINEIIMTADML